MKKTVKENQSILDLVTQNVGTIEAAFEFCATNSLSISEDIFSGQVVDIPDSVEKNIEVADYFTGRKIELATGFPIIEAPLGGIGYMQIGTNFIVS